MDFQNTTVLKTLIDLANHTFDLEQKIDQIPEAAKLGRNIRRMKNSLENAGLMIHNPIGEEWSETRTDCEASITGTDIDNLAIKEVIKPIIRLKDSPLKEIIQRGVVIVGKK